LVYGQVYNDAVSATLGAAGEKKPGRAGLFEVGPGFLRKPGSTRVFDD